MGFLIKDKKSTIPFTKIMKEQTNYIAFPNNEVANFDMDKLLPIGLISVTQFDDSIEDNILIAVPNTQCTFDGDYPFITYSLTDKGWTLDEEYDEGLKYKMEKNYIEYYQKVKAFFNKNQYLTYQLDTDDSDDDEKEPLFELGGQPPLGQNWDSVMYDEMEDNPELDNYHDVIEEGSGDDYELMRSKEITYFDEALGKEFIYVGMFSYDVYLDGGGECIAFYQPELKKVMVVAEFS